MPSPQSELVFLPGTTPSPCRGLVARQIGSHEVCLSWQPPVSCGGMPIIAYRVTHRSLSHGCLTGETRAEMVFNNQNAHWMRHIVSGLQVSTEYGFSVCAINDIGSSETANVMWPVYLQDTKGVEGKSSHCV